MAQILDLARTTRSTHPRHIQTMPDPSIPFPVFKSTDFAPEQQRSIATAFGGALTSVVLHLEGLETVGVDVELFGGRTHGARALNRVWQAINFS